LVSRRRPKLGQHFLADLSFRRRILDALPLRRGELAIEIGPGRGAMTGLLAERAGRVVAIELDANLVETLRDVFQGERSIEAIQADILATDIAELCRERKAEACFVFGNIPYYITSPIIHHLFGFRAVIRGMALLVQREVAERLTAQPGQRDYGYLTVLARLYSAPRILLRLPPGAFSPPPKVESALVGFEMRPKFGDQLTGLRGTTGGGASTPNSERRFLSFVKACFAAKRKTLVNNLCGTYSRQAIEKQLERRGLARSARAEQVAVEELAEVFSGLQRSTG
jgi:16S rRNA (adenine1518-N6/adenine1519-N6)-dimethyltransferase